MPEYIIKVTDEFSEQMKARGMSDEYELIRCIDCKHRDTYECMGRDAFYGLKDDDFCSWGEREEE